MQYKTFLNSRGTCMPEVSLSVVKILTVQLLTGLGSGRLANLPYLEENWLAHRYRNSP